MASRRNNNVDDDEILNAKRELGLPETMSDELCAINTAFHIYLVTQSEKDPPSFFYLSRCCTQCSGLIDDVFPIQCLQCPAVWCSSRCYERRQTHQALKDCQFSRQLFFTGLPTEAKGKYLAKYSKFLALSASPLDALPHDTFANHLDFHGPQARMASMYAPKIGWLHGPDKIGFLDRIYSTSSPHPVKPNTKTEDKNVTHV